MTYATQDDLVKRFGAQELIERTDPVNVAAIDADVVARILADADAEIDGYVAGRYTLPLPSVPHLLVGIACDIARFRLMGESTTEETRKRYEDAVKLLKAIASGLVVLPNAVALVPSSSGVAVAQRSPERVFDPDSLVGF